MLHLTNMLLKFVHVIVYFAHMKYPVNFVICLLDESEWSHWLFIYVIIWPTNVIMVYIMYTTRPPIALFSSENLKWNYSVGELDLLILVNRQSNTGKANK